MRMNNLKATLETLPSTPTAFEPNIGAVETSRGAGEIKYVFICGMPRSGTTIVAKEIASLANCTGFENTGVMMDEGQYLQNVYPTEWACGGAGRFGFAAEAHLTEESPLLTPGNVARLHKSWEAYWDRDKTIRVEKTPGNLLKTRFLQAAFPNARFIVVKRHPVPAGLATQKWSLTPLHELFAHWLHCHKLFDEDKKHLNHLFELSYEDYIRDPRKFLGEIAKFLGTEFSGSLQEQVSDGYDKKYFDRWARMLKSSPFKVYYRRVAQEYEREFRERGYSLAPSPSETGCLSDDHKAVHGILPSLLYLGSDILFTLRRAGRRLRIWVEDAATGRPLSFRS
jgi:sulfotransferase family protein